MGQAIMYCKLQCVAKAFCAWDLQFPQCQFHVCSIVMAHPSNFFHLKTAHNVSDPVCNVFSSVSFWHVVSCQNPSSHAPRVVNKMTGDSDVRLLCPWCPDVSGQCNTWFRRNYLLDILPLLLIFQFQILSQSFLDRWLIRGLQLLYKCSEIVKEWCNVSWVFTRKVKNVL